MRLWKKNVVLYNFTYDYTCTLNYFEALKLRMLNINIQEDKIDQLQKLFFGEKHKKIQFRDKNLSEHELHNNINKSVIAYDTFEKNGILEKDKNIKYERNENLEENTKIENELSTNTNTRSRNIGNIEYDPIKLTQSALNEE
ncbi:hypothetical protein Glove_135g59 [Diversispora epigaea]|uniref:Uncharacterized protein n=1 Tax=Diversispora epigaea TaxID=1348612 RepID=A0A397J5Y5_9GLOM|nr:hypothetical protein Glove_135g59 [Diversispora epigaea]